MLKLSASDSIVQKDTKQNQNRPMETTKNGENGLTKLLRSNFPTDRQTDRQTDKFFDTIYESV